MRRVCRQIIPPGQRTSPARPPAALLFLSGARADAFCTLPIEAVDLERRVIRQWPSLGVRTKNGKSATTHLLDVPELLVAARAWDGWVRGRLPDTAPWYAPFRSRLGELELGEGRSGRWRTTALDRRLRRLAELAGVPYRLATSSGTGTRCAGAGEGHGGLQGDQHEHHGLVRVRDAAEQVAHEVHPRQGSVSDSVF